MHENDTNFKNDFKKIVFEYLIFNLNTQILR